jgi:hypothetical protein
MRVHFLRPARRAGAPPVRVCVVSNNRREQRRVKTRRRSRHALTPPHRRDAGAVRQHGQGTSTKQRTTLARTHARRAGGHARDNQVQVIRAREVAHHRVRHRRRLVRLRNDEVRACGQAAPAAPQAGTPPMRASTRAHALQAVPLPAVAAVAPTAPHRHAVVVHPTGHRAGVHAGRRPRSARSEAPAGLQAPNSFVP